MSGLSMPMPKVLANDFAPFSKDMVQLCVAWLCEDCHWISAAPQGRCVHCASQALMSLAGVLNREAGSAERKGGTRD